jgi:hypothetical protein
MANESKKARSDRESGADLVAPSSIPDVYRWSVARPDPQRYNREGRDWKTVQIHGREVYEVRTLLDAAHRAGLVSIETRELFHDPAAKVAVHAARVEFADGTVFTGHGDASPDNVNRGVLPHYYRVSETRAIGRALAFALNADANFREEFSGNEVDENDARGGQDIGDGPWYCSSCGRQIVDSTKMTARQKVELSLRQSGKILCYSCRSQ